MISIDRKDITTVTEGIVAHGCNCSGGFGSGVAGAVRRKWPEVYQAFSELTPSLELLGTFQPVLISPKLIVCNCFTQVHFGSDGKKYADAKAVEKALLEVYNLALSTGLHVYIPQIGCGLGGLSWLADVEPIIQKLDNQFSIVDTYVCTL